MKVLLEPIIAYLTIKVSVANEQGALQFVVSRRHNSILNILVRAMTNIFTGVLLWILLSHWKCSAIQPSNEDRSSKANSTLSEKNHTKQDISQLHSPGNGTLECSMLWSCCGREAYQNRDILPYGIVNCGENNALSILNGYCLTIDEETDTLEAGRCLYNYNTHDRIYNDLPRSKSKLNDFMCGLEAELNRTGTLCGKCQDGYYPLAYSYDMTCVQCPNGKSNWWKFVLAAFLPLTIFCIIILFFEINVVSSRFQGFLFYSQMISTPAMVRVFMLLGNYYTKSETHTSHVALRSLAAFYGIWNLDFFRSMKLGICLGTDTLQTLSLDFIVGVYPLLLIVVSYVLIELYDRNFRPVVIMWKPFRRLFSLFKENRDLRTSIIDSFATTFLLANIKFQSVSFDLLIPIKAYHLYDTGNWTYSYRLFYDATVPYFGSRHLPYAITAVIVTILCTLLPVLLLILYPFRCFQKFLNLLPVRWYILHTFVDSFYGSYKDGTQPGTRDCRWFASLFFLSRFCMMFAGAYTESAMYFPTATMILVMIALLFVNVQPFKENYSHFTYINVCHVLLLALWNICFIGIRGASFSQWQSLLYLIMLVVVVFFPLLFISAIVLHWMCSQRKFGTDVIAKIRAWRNGYDIIP